MPGRSYSATGAYRYGFNGKENDNEIKGEGDSCDFGARIYDPRFGRFLSVDPLIESFPWQSPYVFAANNPIKLIDVLGMGPEDPTPIYHRTFSSNAASIGQSGFDPANLIEMDLHILQQLLKVEVPVLLPRVVIR